MSYAAITPFAHADTLVAAPLTQLAANLDAAHERFGDIKLNWPSAHAVAGVDNDQAYMVHRYRWFWFQSNGAIVDAADPTNTTTLTEDTEPTMLDLNSVSWLYPGKLYYITGVTWCMETRAIAPQFDYFLRLENGGYWLLENGGRILTERG